ncbi:MAG: hypothetical protein ABIJ19_01335, partial [Patescibacteria group bacterium]
TISSLKIKGVNKMKDIIRGGESRIEVELHLWVFRFKKWQHYGGPVYSFGMMWLGPFLINGWYVRKGSGKSMWVGKNIFSIVRHT